MKKITLGLSVAALAIAGTAAGGAYAQNAMRGDADGNGVVTRAEAQTRANERFARMDANSDGKIDQADREARMGRMFDGMDTDKSGQVSRAEFMAAHQAMRAGHGGMGMGRGAGSPEGHQGAHGGKHGGKMKHGMAKMADADNNGVVSQAEFTAAAMQRFDRADANKDGQITAEERQAARAQMRSEMHRAHAGQKPAE